jgi:hypothetical protein
MSRNVLQLFLSLVASTATLIAAPTNGPARAKVFVSGDPGATAAFVADAGITRRLVLRGLMAVAGRDTATEAWNSLVRPADVVGFKVTSAPGALIGTRPAVVEALVATLLEAGHPATNIVIWDRDPRDLQTAGFVALAARLGVRTAATTVAGWDPAKSYNSPISGKLVFGDLEFGKGDRFAVGRKSHVSLLLTHGITKIVTVAPLLAHNSAGVNGHLLSLAFGSVDNVFRFDGDPGRAAETVPELCALDDLMPRVVFGVSDALVGQVRGDDTARLHDTVALNEIRFSTDLVALDRLAMVDIETARKSYPIDGEKPFKTDLYLNAELLDLGVADLKRIEVVRVP